MSDKTEKPEEMSKMMDGILGRANQGLGKILDAAANTMKNRGDLPEAIDQAVSAARQEAGEMLTKTTSALSGAFGRSVDPVLVDAVADAEFVMQYYADQPKSPEKREAVDEAFQRLQRAIHAPKR
jgi:hypothetical protein